MAKTEQCHVCAGSGEHAWHNGIAWVTVKCIHCGGSGIITVQTDEDKKEEGDKR